MTNNKEQILRFVNEDLVQEAITIDSGDDLLVSGLIDSMSIMRLVAFIEKEFNVAIPPQDVIIENFENVDAISEYIGNSQKTDG
jgi:acyl carrier protein